MTFHYLTPEQVADLWRTLDVDAIRRTMRWRGCDAEYLSVLRSAYGLPEHFQDIVIFVQSPAVYIVVNGRSGGLVFVVTVPPDDGPIHVKSRFITQTGSCPLKPLATAVGAIGKATIDLLSRHLAHQQGGVQ